MTWIILDAIMVYILIFWDFYASIETRRHLYKLEYNGILWIALDCWSIVKYKSPDKPMKMISFQILDAK